MQTQGSRLHRLEQKHPKIERQFIAWKGTPWAPAQMAEAIRREPHRRIFSRALRNKPTD